MIATLIAVLVIIAAIIQMAYWGYFFTPVFRMNFRDKDGAQHRAAMPDFAEIPVSAVICARNEAGNLQKNLPFILEQHYLNAHGEKHFEVLVVNDQSSDESRQVLAVLEKQYKHLKVIDIPLEEQRTFPGKKFALSKAIAAAYYDHILMTDADCKPTSKAWITWMAYPFLEGKEIVGGYGGYYKTPGLLNKFIRCETIHTYLQFMTYNRADVPYMAVGRNLACKKALLLKAQQHELWSKTASGDDDLLISLCATQKNMAVNTHPASFTLSDAKETVDEWVKQKQRHFSTGKLYRRTVQLLLGGYAFSHALFWMTFLLSLFVHPAGMLWKVTIWFALIRCALFWTTFSELSDRIEDRRIKFFWPLFDLGWLFYNAIFAPFIFWKNKQQWK